MRRAIRMTIVTAAVSFFACAAHADVLGWNFTIDPTQEAVPMTGYARGALWDGGTANGTPYGGCIAGTGLQGDGTAVFADDPCESSNSGFVIGGWPGDFTYELCVRVLEDVDVPGADARAKSISIRQADGNGRGIALNTGNITYKHGTGIACGPWDVDLGTWFKIIRISVVGGATNTATTYVWNDPAWVELGSCTMGGSGAAGEITPAGIAVGSLAGSSTQSGKFQVDWVYVDTAMARGNTGIPMGPPPPSPPSCVSSLAGPLLQNATGFTDGGAAPFAQINLGSPDVPNGLSHPIVGDGQTIPAIEAGRNCRRNLAVPGDGFMYFSVDDSLAYAGSMPEVTVSFDYFDSGTGEFILNYDGASDVWSTAPTAVTLTDTNTWKRGSISVTDAWFANREHSGADFRIARGGAYFYIDNVMVTQTGAHGPSLAAYTLSNNGASAFTWNAVEANPDGTDKSPASAWLSLISSPAPGSLPSGASASIEPVIDTSSLTTPTPQGAPLTTYVKITDGCTAGTVLDEPFDYPTGALANKGAWIGDAGTEIAVTTDPVNLRLTANAGTADTEVSRQLDCQSGIIDVDITIHRGVGTSFIGSYRLFADTGESMGEIGLQGESIRIYNPVNRDGDYTDVALPAEAIPLRMHINTAALTNEVYLDGVLQKTCTVASPRTSTIGMINLTSRHRTDVPGDYIDLDDLKVAYEAGTPPFRLRRIDLNVVRCRYAVDPGLVVPVYGGCASTSQQSFALINTGTTTLTSFTVDTVLPGTGGQVPPWPHYTFSWLPGSELLPQTVTCNLAPGESLEQTVTIDWTQLTVGIPDTALLKVNIPDCDDPLGEVKTTLTATKVAVPVPGSYQLIAYNGATLPEVAGSAGVGQQFATWDTAPPDTSDRVSIVDDPDAEDGKAFRLNDGPADQTEYYSTPAPNILPTTGATVVGRIKTESYSASDGNPRRRGNIWIWGPSISANIHWGGPTGEVREELRDESVYVTGDTDYHTIRVTSKDMGGSQGIVVKVYFDEDPTPILWLTNASAQDSPVTGGIGGFGFGVRSGSDIQPIDIDCFNGTDAGAFAPGEDEDCLGLSLATCPNPCHTPFADADGDQDVDQNDFAVFQLCYTGPGAGPLPSSPEYCACLDKGDDDHDGQPDLDGDIDSFDLTAFEDCASGPGVPADPNCS